MLVEDYLTHTNWAEVNDYLNQVASIVDPHDHSGVYGIPRGGLVLASWLAHKLYLPLLFAPAKNCIIIDDICDSGETLRQYMRNTSHSDEDNNYFITTMFYRPNNELGVQPTHYFKEKGEQWIIFPWEE